MSGTGGGWRGTNGGRYRLGMLATAGAALLLASIETASVIYEVGDRRALWEPVVWQLTSVGFWILLVPLLWRVTIPLRPPRWRWPMVLLAYLALSLPVSAAHVATLAALRPPLYALLGGQYQPNWSRQQLAYEYSKDLPVMLLLIAFGVATHEWAQLATPRAPAPAEPPPFRFEVRDGARRRWLAPAEFERVEAAGNYVILHGPAGELLHRATLTAVAAELADHGFVRIHRSRLVRRDAVAALVPTASGDFEVVLASSARVPGSRRFRASLG